MKKLLALILALAMALALVACGSSGTTGSASSTGSAAASGSEEGGDASTNATDLKIGCILVGENKAKGRVLNSTPYEVELTRRIKEAIAAGDTCTIEIR